MKRAVFFILLASVRVAAAADADIHVAVPAGWQDASKLSDSELPAQLRSDFKEFHQLGFDVAGDEVKALMLVTLEDSSTFEGTAFEAGMTIGLRRRAPDLNEMARGSLDAKGVGLRLIEFRGTVDGAAYSFRVYLLPFGKRSALVTFMCEERYIVGYRAAMDQAMVSTAGIAKPPRDVAGIIGGIVVGALLLLGIGIYVKRRWL